MKGRGPYRVPFQCPDELHIRYREAVWMLATHGR